MPSESVIIMVQCLKSLNHSLFMMSRQSHYAKSQGGYSSYKAFNYAQKGGITIGRVPRRSVLYLLYIKHDQKILKFDMSIGRGGGQSVIPCLVNTAISYSPVGRRARQ